MLKNYLTVALRNLRRNKGYAAINIAGPSIGMAASLLILLFVRHELNYDRHHPHAERIFRVTWGAESSGRATASATVAPLAPVLAANYPEIETAIRLRREAPLVRHGDKRFYEERFFFADPEILRVFSFVFLQGSPATALQNPNSVLITQAMSQKYFGSQNPLGKRLTVSDTLDLQVSGVLAESRSPAHFHADFIAPLSPRLLGDDVNAWFIQRYWNYIKLKEGTAAEEVEQKISGVVGLHGADQQERFGVSYKLYLQPVTDIHLHSNLWMEIEPTGSATMVTVFAAVAVLILIIAAINFINLSTARANQRAKEIGVRKVLGAHRRRVMRQFLSESVLISLLALLFALLLVELSLPLFTALCGTPLIIDYLHNPAYLGQAFAIALLAGLSAGIFPALLLAAFRPVEALKGVSSLGMRGEGVRKTIVAVQFAASTVLIIGTIVIFQQLHFMRNQELGFNEEQILAMSFRGDLSMVARYETLKSELLKIPGVAAVTGSSTTPGQLPWSRFIRPEGKDANTGRQTFAVDADFDDVYGLEIVAGRFFKRELETDIDGAFVINEAMVALYEWGSPEQALGKILISNEIRGPVIGVLKDFHFRSLHQDILPLFMVYRPDRLYTISVKITSQNLSAVVASFEKAWRQLFPDAPFDYYFIDESFDRQYRADERLSKIFTAFSSFAIFIACLGLFGLAAYSAEQRTKEIGIRKVLGATVPGIVGLLSKDFVKLVLLANFIAWPVAWFAMNKWLQNFAYRIDIGWWVFALAGGIALIIALLTVSAQAIRAALANPVEALRYE